MSAPLHAWPPPSLEIIALLKPSWRPELKIPTLYDSVNSASTRTTCARDDHLNPCQCPEGRIWNIWKQHVLCGCRPYTLTVQGRSGCTTHQCLPSRRHHADQQVCLSARGHAVTATSTCDCHEHICCIHVVGPITRQTLLQDMQCLCLGCTHKATVAALQIALCSTNTACGYAALDSCHVLSCCGCRVGAPARHRCAEQQPLQQPEDCREAGSCAAAGAVAGASQVSQTVGELRGWAADDSTQCPVLACSCRHAARTGPSAESLPATKVREAATWPGVFNPAAPALNGAGRLCCLTERSCPRGGRHAGRAAATPRAGFVKCCTRQVRR